MKKSISCLLSAFLSVSIFAQIQIEYVKKWEKTIDAGSSWEEIRNMVEAEDNNYVFIGNSENSNAGEYNVWLAKINSSGDTLWTKKVDFKSQTSDYLYDVAVTQENNYLFIGYTTDGDEEILLHCRSAAGDSLWTKVLDLHGNQRGINIIKAQNNDFIITGGCNDNSSGLWILKINQTGDTLWAKQYKNGPRNVPVSVVKTSDNNYLLAGYCKQEGNSNFDYWIVKFDEKGDTLWTKTYGGNDIDIPSKLINTADNGYLISGYSRSLDGDITNPHGDYDFWLLKLNTQGNVQWSKNYGTINPDYAQSVFQSKDNNYVVSGYSYNPEVQTLIYNIDQEGNIRIEKSDTSGQTFCSGGAFIFAGCTDMVTEGGNILKDYWYAHYGMQYSITQEEDICSDDSIFLQGIYRHQSGTYYDSLKTYDNCDSVIITILSVNEIQHIIIDTTLCHGQSIWAGGAYQNLQGTYYDTLVSSVECDSIVQTNLQFMECDTVSSLDNYTEDHVFVYPIPAREIILVNCPDEILYLELYSVSGQRLSVAYKNEMLLGAYSPGFYYLRIYTETGRNFTRKVLSIQ